MILTVRKTKKIAILATFIAFGLAQTVPAQAATVVWDFNLPATATSSLAPSYPSLGLLTLQDSTCGTVDCVKFTFDPNEANPGYNPGGSASTIDRMTIAFTTTKSDETDPQNDHSLSSIAGSVAVDSWNWSMFPPANDDNLDAGFDTDGEGQFTMIWDNPNFLVSSISMWSILNTTIADNFSVMGTANSKPSPTFGVLSVSPKIVVQDINGDNINPTPSNWVTSPSPVPVPAAVWLFGTALIGFIGFSRRRSV